jgi:hypothetical protein
LIPHLGTISAWRVIKKKVVTSWTKKKSSPASSLRTVFGRRSVWSLQAPTILLEGNGTFGLCPGPVGFPAQLAPMWKVNGRGLDDIRREGVLLDLRNTSRAMAGRRYVAKGFRGDIVVGIAMVYY